MRCCPPRISVGPYGTRCAPLNPVESCCLSPAHANSVHCYTAEPYRASLSIVHASLLSPLLNLRTLLNPTQTLMEPLQPYLACLAVLHNYCWQGWLEKRTAHGTAQQVDPSVTEGFCARTAQHSTASSCNRQQDLATLRLSIDMHNSCAAAVAAAGAPASCQEGMWCICSRQHCSRACRHALLPCLCESGVLKRLLAVQKEGLLAVNCSEHNSFNTST